MRHLNGNVLLNTETWIPRSYGESFAHFDSDLTCVFCALCFKSLKLTDWSSVRALCCIAVGMTIKKSKDEHYVLHIVDVDVCLCMCCVFYISFSVIWVTTRSARCPTTASVTCPSCLRCESGFTSVPLRCLCVLLSNTSSQIHRKRMHFNNECFLLEHIFL